MATFVLSSGQGQRPADDAGSVLTMRQADRRFGAAIVRRHMRNGRWQSPARGVVVRHNGELDAEEKLLVALFAAPTGSALGGHSALVFDGMPQGLALPAQVIVPRSARRSGRPGVRMSYSRHLDDPDVHPLQLPRRTRPPRSLIDAASWALGPGQARLALVEGVQASVVTPEQLWAALPNRAQCRHLGVIQETISDLAGGVRSLPEREFSLLVRRSGLPRPDRQAAARGSDGRYYLDADWPAFRLSAEVHGAHHAGIRQLDHDWRRHNELTVQGRRVVHFSSFAVRHEPTRVAELLCKAMS